MGWNMETGTLSVASPKGTPASISARSGTTSVSAPSPASSRRRWPCLKIWRLVWVVSTRPISAMASMSAAVSTPMWPKTQRRPASGISAFTSL